MWLGLGASHSSSKAVEVARKAKQNRWGSSRREDGLLGQGGEVREGERDRWENRGKNAKEGGCRQGLGECSNVSPHGAAAQSCS